ncbi:unnamed protein product, partial [Brassica rapa]
GLKLVSCTSSPILVVARNLFSLRFSTLYLNLSGIQRENFTSTKWDKLRDAGYYNEWFQVISLQIPTASLFSCLLLCLFGIVSFVK